MYLLYLLYLLSLLYLLYLDFLLETLLYTWIDTRQELVYENL